MKKKFFCLLITFGFLFMGCEFLALFDDLVDDYDNQASKEEISLDLNVYAFNEDSVILDWTYEKSNARYNIYVKNKDGKIFCVEDFYGKTDYFVSGNNQSSYAIGLIEDGKEIGRTKFIYPNLEDIDDIKAGFPVSAKISAENLLGVEFFYPSNIDLFSLEIVKENTSKIITTKKYSEAEMNHSLFPLCYEKNSINNYFTVIFTIEDEDEGKNFASARYYFDYNDELIASENGTVIFYPTF